METKKIKTYTAYHRGELKECLETENKISFETFEKLVKSGIYEFYAYDERIKAYRYILVNMEKNIGMPTWLHYYGNKKPL